MKQNTITIPKIEFEDMKDLMERMRETIEVLSSKKTLSKIKSALERFKKGDYLTEEQIYA